MDRALGGALELFTARRPRCGSTVRDRGSRWAVAVAMLVAVGLANLAVARAVQAGFAPWPLAARAVGLAGLPCGSGPSEPSDCGLHPRSRCRRIRYC